MTKELNQDLVAKVLALPSAPKLLEEIQQALILEQKRRLKFYDEITEQEKVEFINGEVIIHSPVKRVHNEACGNLYKMIDTFVVLNHLGFVGVEKIMVQFTRNDYEPDICFFDAKQTREFKKEQVLFPVPNFIIEVLSKSTEHRDRGIKFADYQDHGVLEYWLVDPQKKIVEQYILKRGKYELMLKAGDGKIKSKAIKNLSFPIQTIFDKQQAVQWIRGL